MKESLRRAWKVVRERTAFVGPLRDRWAAGWRWELLLGVLVLLLLSYSWMFGDITVPNERSRVYLAVAVVDHGSLSIDKPVERYGAIFDWARRGNHYYTDKAPGSSLLGIGPYWLARRFTEPGDWKISELVNLMRTWVMLPLALIGFFWMRRLLRRLELPPPAVDVASLAWALGTAAFHYGTAYYGHQIVAVCLVGALDLVVGAERALEAARAAGGPSPPFRRLELPLLGAGALAGMAGLTEYQAGIPAALLVAYAAAGPLRRRPLVLSMLLAGAIPFAVLLFGYNTLAFGGPFKLSYHFLIDPGLREIHGQGIGGVSWPKWEYAFGGLFSLHRGFFVTSPIFLLAMPGLVLMARRGLLRLAVLLGAALLYFLLFISSTKIWYAGWSFGPRLLVPVMAWTMVPVAFCVSAMGRWLTTDGLARGLALAGIAYHQAVHAVFPEMPENAANPLSDAVLPALRGREVSPNLATKLFGWHGRRSLVPLLVLGLLAGAAVVLRGADRTRTRDERAARIGVAIGCALLLALYILLHKPGWKPDDVKWFTGWLKELAAAERRLQ